MTWDRLSTLPPLRDEHGTIVLEEADDDTHTATFRVYGSRSLTVRMEGDQVRFDGEAPPMLRQALAPAAIGRWVAAGRRA
jgi:hypothetical protein